MNETIRVGDRVRIKALSCFSANHIGQTGTVTETDWLGYANNGYSYAVDIDGGPAGRLYRREDLERITPAKSAAEIDAEVSELPLANRQAAQYAHDLLGDSADLDKLIGVAEFVMDRRTLGTETTGTVSVGAITINAPSETAPSTATPRPADLVLRDRDGDEIHLSVVGKAWEVLVDVPGEQGANLTGGNLDAAIKFLTAARDYHRQA